MNALHPPVFLFTDFGAEGPYLAQMEAAMLAVLPRLRVLNLLSNAPTANPRAAAYLLAALVPVLPADAVIVAVVDPGVGTPRQALLLEADGRRLLGPDNGLLVRVAAAAERLHLWRIDWRPQFLAPSFHGRDLFAPAAARLLAGLELPCTGLQAESLVGGDWPPQLDEVIHFDHFGNAYTGICGAGVSPRAVLHCAGQAIAHARVFAAAPRHAPFWYVNSCGLVEIAVNQGRAERVLGLALGDPVELRP